MSFQKCVIIRVDFTCRKLLSWVVSPGETRVVTFGFVQFSASQYIIRLGLYSTVQVSIFRLIVIPKTERSMKALVNFLGQKN